MKQAVRGTLRFYGSTDLPVTQREQSAIHKPLVITGRYMSNREIEELEIEELFTVVHKQA